jgi:hypothetical protein
MPQGSPNRRRWVVTVALVTLALVQPWAHATEPAAFGVLVLRNGNVLKGTVRGNDGFYVVEHAGASLQIPAEQVEMACSTLAEAYERRRADRVGTSADGHLELARWCLKNGLLDQAAREVLDARTRDPGHPALPMLDSAIQMGLELKASREAQGAETVAAPSAAQAPTAQPPTAPLLEPSAEAQTQFVRSIQPMLIQNCVTGGCHQPGAAQQMQLDRWALQGNGNPELIRRNLDAVLAQINVDDPPSSAVMIRSRQFHGGGRYGQSKPLASYQAAILLEWLSEAAGVQPEVPGAETPVEQPAAIQAEPSLAPERSAAINPTPAATAPAFKPRDAFDPEIFNRRMAAQAPSLVGEDPLQRSGGAATDAEIEAAIEALEHSAATAPPASE